MANKTLQDVRTAVNTKLETLKGTNKPFVNVYDFFTSKPSGFPFIQFEPAQLASQYEDTANNYRSFTFQIVIVQEMNTVTRHDAMDIIVKAFDQVTNAFDSDWTLSGTVLQVNATEGQFGELDMEVGPCLFATFNIVCKVLYSI